MTGPALGGQFCSGRVFALSKSIESLAMDLLIAVHTLTLGATLVTDNVTEFRRVSNLKVENWIKC